MDIPETYWIDKKGKKKRIQFMSHGYLNNIRKMFTNDGRNKISDVMDELKRRKNKRKK